MKKIGLIGKHISYTLSPLLYTTLAQKLEESIEFRVFDDEISNMWISKIEQEYCGFSVTIPYKQKILKYCPFKTEAVERLGAANCISVIDHKFHANNTDIFGISQSLAQVNLQGERVLLLGAGGAARATLYVLISRGVKECTLLNRTQVRVDEIIRDFGKQIRINTTRSGVYAGVIHARPYIDEPYTSLISFLKSEAFVFDMVYRPYETQLRNLAKQRKLEFIDGLQMLTWQGMKAWDIWMTSHICEEQQVYRHVYQKLKSELLL